ncbi:MAG: Gfo/Idh/MocA family oxidoreductase [Candidatus Aerophobetes bacterium]|nr:Gfo/Idh/MocA family oxidoreductase [Candidatus Aerophobetes bacterium]
MAKVRVGFIGTGRIAKRHMNKLTKIKDAELVSICDISREEAQKTAKKYKAKFYTEYREMLEKEDLDALYICIPPFTHNDQEIIAANKGINLFIEKPLTLDINKACQIDKVIREKGIISSVGYVYRYADIVNKVREEINGKKIAILLGYYLCPMRDIHWWRIKDQSGGQIVEQSTHLFDLARYLIGEVDKVYAQAFQGLMKDIKNYTIDDASCANLRFKNSTIGNISSACTLSQGRDWGINLIGRGFRIDLLLSSHLLKIVNEEKREIMMKIDPYQAENEAFIRAIKEENPNYIRSSYADALKTLKLTLAANISLEEKRVITVEEELKLI